MRWLELLRRLLGAHDEVIYARFRQRRLPRAMMPRGVERSAHDASAHPRWRKAGQ